MIAAISASSFSLDFSVLAENSFPAATLRGQSRQTSLPTSRWQRSRINRRRVNIAAEPRVICEKRSGDGEEWLNSNAVHPARLPYTRMRRLADLNRILTG